MGRTRRLMVVVAVVTALVGQTLPAYADDGYPTDAGMGFAAVGIDLLYIPAKVVYATLGGLTGGFAFILTGGNMDVASAVWKPSLGGTYVVTPAMVAGNEPIYFSGPVDDDTRVADSRTRADDDEAPRARQYDDEQPRPTQRRGEPY